MRFNCFLIQKPCLTTGLFYFTFQTTKYLDRSDSSNLSTLTAQEGLFDFLITQQILASIFQYNFTNAEHVSPVCNLQGF